MARRVDTNQAEIVAALRGVGARVQLLHTVGNGCPDALVGFRGQLHLLEIKTPTGRLTPDECAWHLDWQGYVHVVRSPEQALRVIGAKLEQALGEE